MVYKDNKPVVLNTLDLESNLKHNVMTISYYFCREYIVGVVVEVHHNKRKENIADRLTKSLHSTNFYNCFIFFMCN